MKWLAIAFAIFLAGCDTMPGTYMVSAVDSEGKPAGGKFIIQDGSVHRIRNLLCKQNPNAVVTIKDQKTGEDVKGESPYKCP